MKNIIYDDSQNVVAIDALYFVGGYATYEIYVSTFDFSGIANFCIAENMIKNTLENATAMVDTLCGELLIEDTESDAFLKFFFENDRELYVVGQIGGSHEDNMLKFKLKADQTILIGLKKALLAY